VQTALLLELPAYVPFSRFISFLDRLEAAGIPPRIDRNYWSSFLSGVLGGQLLGALRCFDLVDGAAHPKAAIGQLADRNTRRQAMASLLQRRYAPIFAVADLTRASRGQLDKAFTDAYAVGGDTRRKAVTFFLKACDYAGLQLSREVDLRRGPRRRHSHTTPWDAGELGPDAISPSSANAGIDGVGNRTIVLGDHGTVTLSVRANLLTLDEDRLGKLLRLVEAFRDLDSLSRGPDATLDETKLLHKDDSVSD